MELDSVGSVRKTVMKNRKRGFKTNALLILAIAQMTAGGAIDSAGTVSFQNAGTATVKRIVSVTQTTVPPKPKRKMKKRTK